MTHRSTWKRFERQVAKDQGVRRTPLSGSASGHTAADTLHKRIFSECKYRKQWQVWSLFEQVRTAASREGKIPCLYLKTKGKYGYLMCFHYEDFQRIVEEYDAKVQPINEDDSQ